MKKVTKRIKGNNEEYVDNFVVIEIIISSSHLFSKYK